MRNCKTCALGKTAKPEGAVYCHKFERLIPPADTGRDWGCRYFTEAVPGEDCGPQQYLLLKESELADKK
ncbi:MAG: hypothetical protein HPY58_01500 [Firmicutes bacterium]|nr:hypothetical protein [Bacillota bacterium]